MAPWRVRAGTEGQRVAPAAPAPAPPAPGSASADVLALQRLAGNAATVRAVAGGDGQIRRLVSGKLLAKTNKVFDPAKDRPRGEYTLGYCPPVLNGARIEESGGEQAARPHLAAPTLRAEATDAGVSVSVAKMPTNKVTSQQDLLVKPPWRNKKLDQMSLIRATEGIDLALSEKPWEEGGSFEVVGEGGKPANLAQQVKVHEDKHAEDNLDVGTSILGPWDSALQAAKDARTTFDGPDRATAEAALYAKAGGTPDEIADRLVHEWGDRSQKFHRTPEGETTVHDPDLDLDRRKVTLEITQP